MTREVAPSFARTMRALDADGMSPTLLAVLLVAGPRRRVEQLAGRWRACPSIKSAKRRGSRSSACIRSPRRCRAASWRRRWCSAAKSRQGDVLLEVEAERERLETAEERVAAGHASAGEIERAAARDRRGTGRDRSRRAAPPRRRSTEASQRLVGGGSRGRAGAGQACGASLSSNSRGSCRPPTRRSARADERGAPRGARRGRAPASSELRAEQVAAERGRRGRVAGAAPASAWRSKASATATASTVARREREAERRRVRAPVVGTARRRQPGADRRGRPRRRASRVDRARGPGARRRRVRAAGARPAAAGTAGAAAARRLSVDAVRPRRRDGDERRQRDARAARPRRARGQPRGRLARSRCSTACPASWRSKSSASRRSRCWSDRSVTRCRAEPAARIRDPDDRRSSDADDLSRRGSARRAFLAPEVVQTSAMDCGPAALKCLLEGFGIPASYAAPAGSVSDRRRRHLDQHASSRSRWRSGSTPSRSCCRPITCCSRRRARFPALLVVRRDNMTHFLVAWRRHGPFVQVMDPAKGRRWLRARRAPATSCTCTSSRCRRRRGGSGPASRGFSRLPARTAARAGRSAPMPRARCLTQAADDPGWRARAARRLDAAWSPTSCGRRAAARPRSDARDRDDRPSAWRDGTNAGTPRARRYWSVLPDPTRGGDMLVASRRRAAARPRAARRRRLGTREQPSAAAPIGAAEQVARVARPIGRRAAAGRRRGVCCVATGSPRPRMLGAAAAARGRSARCSKCMLLRGFARDRQRPAAARASPRDDRCSCSASSPRCSCWSSRSRQACCAIGRRLETRLRAALLDKLPALGDRYFREPPRFRHGPPRAQPRRVARAARISARASRGSAMQLVFTAFALAWLDPAERVDGALSAGASRWRSRSATERMLAERELRQRSHAAALSRHYLDSLLGLSAARTHGAERRAAPAARSAARRMGPRRASTCCAAAIVDRGRPDAGRFDAGGVAGAGFVGRGSQPGSTLLLVYWALNLPVLGRELAGDHPPVPGATGTSCARCCEPLTRPEETPAVRDRRRRTRARRASRFASTASTCAPAGTTS